MFSNVTHGQFNITETADNVSAFAENVTSGVTTTADETLGDTFLRVISSWQYHAAVKFHQILPKISLSMGVPGNILSFVVILRMRPFTTSSFLFCGLAVSDLSYLCCSYLYRNQNSLPDPRPLCYSGEYLTWMFTYISLGIACFLTVERGLAVWRPFQVAAIMTMKRCVLAVLVLVVVCAGICVHYLFTYEYVVYPPPVNAQCLVKESMILFSIKIWWKVSIFLSSIGPAVIFLISAIVIIVGLKKSRQLRQQMTCDDTQLKQKGKQSKQVATMLVSVLVLFIITTFPWGIMFATVTMLDEEYGTVKHLWMMFFSTLFLCMKDFNHALNCYCYFFTAARFRAGVLDLMTCGGRIKVKDMHLDPSSTKMGVTAVSHIEKTTPICQTE